MNYVILLATLIVLQTNQVYARVHHCPDFTGTFHPSDDITYLPVHVNGKLTFTRVQRYGKIFITQKGCESIHYDVQPFGEQPRQYVLFLQEKDNPNLNVITNGNSVHFLSELNDGYLQFQEGSLAYVGSSRQTNVKLKIQADGAILIKTKAGRRIVGLGLIPNPMASKPKKSVFRLYPW